MLIREFRREFKEELKSDFSEGEISAFFYSLLPHITGLSRLDLAVHPELQLPDAQKSVFRSALKQLRNQVPLQYIIGEAEFHGLSFTVDSRVLIPRPETEELVEWVCEESGSRRDKRILDIGTGSGCIAISLAKCLPGARIFAVDVSEKALQLARENAKKNAVNVNFSRMDILDPPQLEYKYDLIVSNPPYVRQSEKGQMNPNVIEYEPHLALFVENGAPLLFYRKILEFAQKNLNQKGQVYFEVNEYLKEELLSLFEEKGIRDFVFRKDSFNKTRMVRVF